MVLTEDDVKGIEPVAHYTTDEEQAYMMLYGEGVFETIPIEADYTVGDMKLWLKVNKSMNAAEYDLVGPKDRWKMGAGSEVLKDEQARAACWHCHAPRGPPHAPLTVRARARSGQRVLPPLSPRAGCHIAAAQVIADFMGDRFENKWLMQLSLFPKKKNEETGSMESTFETVEEWVPPPPEEAFSDEEDDEPAKVKGR
tara:strand:- start:1339 stop:1932 length:594 start_codon:yes stop_codon:yes gene_type:complete